MKQKIVVHNTESFRKRYMKPEQKLDAILKSGYQKFFIVKVQDMIRLIKLPVPPVRSTIHNFIFLTSGEAVMTIGSETFTIYKNQCLFVPSGIIYSFKNLDINKGFLFGFEDDFFVGRLGKKDVLKDFEFLNIWGNPKTVFDNATAKNVLFLLKRMYDDYSINGLENLSLLQSYLLTLFCEVDRVYQPLSASKQIHSVELTNKFKQLVFTNIKIKHLVTDYADMLYISPNHLNKVVKQITGKSPTKWIDEALLLEAKMLLHQTNLSINEIAAEIGILDASYFSRLFKKYEKKTPLQFRSMIEKS